MTIGSKVIIRASEYDAFIGKVGVIEGMAPNGNDTTIYKVRVGDMILPGWFGDEHLAAQPRTFTTLIFDLDGTLTDSGEGIMRCAQYALQKMGIPVNDHHSLRPFVGPPLEDSFKTLFNFSDEQAAQAVSYYRERYFSKGVYEQSLYPGAKEMLEELKKNGYRLAIGTSKMLSQTTYVLDYLGIRDYFDTIGARDEKGLLHTKADVLNSLLNNMGMSYSKNDCVMIGDRRYDVEGARQVGIKSIGVLWGYGDELELRSAKADYLATDFKQLSSLL